MIGKEETICKHLDFGFATGSLLHCGEVTHEGRNRESSSAACVEAALICG